MSLYEQWTLVVLYDFDTYRVVLHLCLARRRKTKSTNAAYIQNFDKTPTAKSANPDLISQCIEAKTRHNSVSVKIVSYHKSPLLIETHDMATEAMAKTRKEYHHAFTSAK